MAAAPRAAPPRRSEARNRRGRVTTIAAVTGTRISAKCSLIMTVAPAQQAARPTRCDSCAASSNAVTAKGSKA